MNPLGAASGRGSGLMPGCSEASSSEKTLSETHFERSDLFPRLDVPSGGGVSFQANLSVPGHTRIDKIHEFPSSFMNLLHLHITRGIHE